MAATAIRTIVDGDDLELKDCEVPYELIRNLGNGGFGVVEEVRDVLSNRHFAKKKMRLDIGSLEEAQNMFKQEVEVIRELQSHPHVINVHATYICGRELNIVLKPVADGGDLARVLSDFRDGNEDEQKPIRVILRRAYGCLAKCLEFIHSDKHINSTAKEIIRHKDIKPKNILVHEGYVLLTDFGISKRCIDGITTTNDNGPHSPVYSAPEVIEDTRNRKADVFSLGCVFLEIFLALRSDHRPAASRTNTYAARVNDIQHYLKAHGSSGIAGVIHDMLHADPKERPSASDVVARLSTADEENACKKCAGKTSTE
jgi:serine/threonine protein kinase